MNAPMPSSVPPAAKKPNKIVPIIVVVLLVLLGLGAGLLALAQNGGPVADFVAKLGLPAKTDADIVKDGIVALMNESSADLAVTAHVEGSQDGEPMNFDLTWNGEGISFKSGASQPGQGTVAVNGTASGSSIDAAFSYRSIPPKTYVSVSKLSIPGMPFDVSSLAGQWIAIDASDQNAPQPSDLLPGLLPKEQACDADPKQLSAFWDSVDGDTLFTVTRAGTISLDEQAQGYAVVLNKEGMTKAINDLGHNVSDCAAENMDELIKDQFTVNSLTIYVGSFSHVVRGIDLSMPIPASGSGEIGTITATIRFSNFGHTPDVQVPADAKPFEDVIAELMFGGMMGGTMPTSINPAAGGTGADYFPPTEDLSGMSDADIQKMIDEMSQEQGGFGDIPQ